MQEIRTTPPRPRPDADATVVRATTIELPSVPRGRGLHRRFAGWDEHVGVGRALWVDVASQRVWLIEDEDAAGCWPCSTAAAGLGEEEGSFRTPRGWHEVAEKIGGELPMGAILRGRRWTGEVWMPDASGGADEDLVLTRILRLAGREPGRNLGGNRDSFGRFIYLHGTNDEGRLGQAASHGCIRVSNAAIVELYDLVDTGCPVLVD